MWIMIPYTKLLLHTSVAYAISATLLPAQTFTTLLSFGSLNGSQPYAAMIQAADGNLYGTTQAGGAYNYGEIFKMTPGGKLTSLYSFCSGVNCVDGAYPQAALVQDEHGNFYGTTLDGGASCFGCGSIFKFTPGSALTTLYSFSCQVGKCPNGANPTAGLVKGFDGNFYGTTLVGGATEYGTVFKITPSGTLTTLYQFCLSTCTDGFSPASGLTLAPNGDFYGTTVAGGLNGHLGSGTVFKITPGGALTTLYTFTGGGDGWFPNSLILATDGDFYGTTQYGGAYGWGTVFRITPSGALTTLYSFCAQSGCADGANPVNSVVQGTDGNLYGTTFYGGLYTMNGGTVFEVTPAGALTTLHSFCAQGPPFCADGEAPQGGLMQDTNGRFYGTNRFGGAGNYGTVFTLAVDLGPFVRPQPASGKIGAAIEILGTNLTGATGVSFNGVAAPFKVVSGSLIRTAVPSGAASGTIQVVTPGGTLSSNMPFRVRP